MIYKEELHRTNVLVRIQDSDDNGPLFHCNCCMNTSWLLANDLCRLSERQLVLLFGAKDSLNVRGFRVVFEFLQIFLDSLLSIYWPFLVFYA